MAETTVKRLLYYGFQRTGKAMEQLYQCWWRLYREINVFFLVGLSHVLRFISICDLFTDSHTFNCTSNAVRMYPRVKNLDYTADFYFRYFQKTYNANVPLHLRGWSIVTLKIACTRIRMCKLLPPLMDQLRHPRITSEVTPTLIHYNRIISPQFWSVNYSWLMILHTVSFYCALCIKWKYNWKFLWVHPCLNSWRGEWFQLNFLSSITLLCPGLRDMNFRP
jgi:hypothetical protein